MGTSNHPDANALLAKFHRGECTPADLALLEEWYQTLDQNQSETDSPALRLSQAETDRRLQQFLTGFRKRQHTAKIYRMDSPRVRWAAACLILLAGLSYIGVRYFAGSSRQLAANQLFHIENNTGKIKRILLSDSSEVWLNAHASLSWKNDFNGTERNISLSGEGFFDVHRDGQRPFIIHTRDLAIRVLGTAFNVEAYPGEKMTRVSLVQGLVQVNAVKDTTTHTLLRPGYAAVYSNDAPRIDVSETAVDMVAAWKKGGFTVKDLSFKDAVTRWCDNNEYQVKWKTTGGIHKIVSASFEKGNFEQVLSALCYMSHKKYAVSGKQITIY